MSLIISCIHSVNGDHLDITINAAYLRHANVLLYEQRCLNNTKTTSKLSAEKVTLFYIYTHTFCRLLSSLRIAIMITVTL